MSCGAVEIWKVEELISYMKAEKGWLRWADKLSEGREGTVKVALISYRKAEKGRLRWS